MLLRRAPGIVAAVILLPLLILAPTLHGYTAMVCRLTGAIMSTDCAPAPALDDSAEVPSADDRGDSGTGRWLDESCCDFVRVTFAQPPADGATQSEHQVRVVASLPMPGPAVRMVWMTPLTNDEATAQPGIGPPRRLLTQTFLL